MISNDTLHSPLLAPLPRSADTVLPTYLYMTVCRLSRQCLLFISMDRVVHRLVLMDILKLLLWLVVPG
jgi:hypothetical protein